MLIQFKSDKAGGFVMQESVATPLLKMMGMSGKSEGAVSDEAVRTALQKLESALAGLEEPSPSEEEDEDHDEEPAIGLRTRAAPLLELLRRAAAEDGYVMWQPE